MTLHDRLAAPLGFADEIFFGMLVRKRGSLATLVDAPSEVDGSMMQMREDLPMFRAAPMSLFPTAEFGNNPEVIGADIPAGGKTSARAIAKMYAALIGEVDGVRLISPERLAEATTVFGRRSRRGLWKTKPGGVSAMRSQGLLVWMSRKPRLGWAAWEAGGLAPIAPSVPRWP